MGSSRNRRSPVGSAKRDEARKVVHPTRGVGTRTAWLCRRGTRDVSTAARRARPRGHSTACDYGSDAAAALNGRALAMARGALLRGSRRCGCVARLACRTRSTQQTHDTPSRRQRSRGVVGSRLKPGFTPVDRNGKGERSRMWNGFGRVSKWMVLAGFLVGAATPALWGQAQTETPLFRQLHRFDLGLSGIGIFTGSTTGQNYATTTPTPAQAQTVTQTPSNTLGALLTIRYTHSPLVGSRIQLHLRPVYPGLQRHHSRWRADKRLRVFAWLRRAWSFPDQLRDYSFRRGGRRNHGF